MKLTDKDMKEIRNKVKRYFMRKKLRAYKKDFVALERAEQIEPVYNYKKWTL